MNPAYSQVEYAETDRTAVKVLGPGIVDWWNTVPGAFVNTVVKFGTTGEIVAHLQAVDRSLPKPSRRPGEVHLRLIVAPEHRRQRIGSTLLQTAETFARKRNARSLYGAAVAGEAGEFFLRHCGFEEYERFLPSELRLTDFDPSLFAASVARVEALGFRLTTLSALGDTPENQRELYALEQATRADVPFRGVNPYIPVSFEEWRATTESDPESVFIAVAPSGMLVGLVQGMEWNYTGIHPDFRGNGIGLALKVAMLTAAKRRGLEVLPTENHADNAPMLAINRTLGFVFGTPEIAFIKPLRQNPPISS